jgi:Tfp pilus assembly protein PilF
MFMERSIKLLDLGVLRLERAVQRLRQQDRDGALDDLRAALRHMQEGKADPVQAHHLAAIIGAVERQG